jgi:hypothetical protein
MLTGIGSNLHLLHFVVASLADIPQLDHPLCRGSRLLAIIRAGSATDWSGQVTSRQCFIWKPLFTGTSAIRIGRINQENQTSQWNPLGWRKATVLSNRVADTARHRAVHMIWKEESDGYRRAVAAARRFSLPNCFRSPRNPASPFHHCQRWYLSPLTLRIEALTSVWYCLCVPFKVIPLSFSKVNKRL